MVSIDFAESKMRRTEKEKKKYATNNLIILILFSQMNLHHMLGHLEPSQLGLGGVASGVSSSSSGGGTPGPPGASSSSGPPSAHPPPSLPNPLLNPHPHLQV